MSEIYAHVSRTRIPSQRELGKRLQTFTRPKHLAGNLDSGILAGDYELRLPQIDVIDAATQALVEGRGSGLFVRPPRTGKTILFGAIAKGIDEKSVILVPNKDLVGQTYDKLVNVVGIHPGEIGCLHSDITNIHDRHRALDSKILVTTYDTFRNLFQEGEVTPEERPFLILDEVHRANGDQTRPIIKYFMDNGATVQGWTATDMFADGTTVSDRLFDGDPPIHETTFHEAAKRGEIAPTWWHGFSTDMNSGIRLVKQGEDISEKDALRIVKQNGRDEGAIDKIMGFEDTVKWKDGTEWTNKFRDLPQLWYCAGVEHAEKIARQLNEQYDERLKTGSIDKIKKGHETKNKGDSFSRYAVAMSGETPNEDFIDATGEWQPGRKTIFRAYEEGRVKCIASADLLIEGYDFPHCELTVMLRPTMSPRIVVQAGARSTGLNPNDPKKIGYVTQFLDDDYKEVVPTFKKVVGGTWMAPNDFPDFHPDFDKEGDKGTLPDRDKLPAAPADYDEYDKATFTETQHGVRVLPSKIPEGFIPAPNLLRNPEYRKYTENFRTRLELLLQEFERQYEHAQNAMPRAERYQQPFKTEQNVHVALVENVSGGLTMVVNQEEMEHYIQYEMMPEPLLDEAPEGFIFPRHVIRDYALSKDEYAKVDHFLVNTEWQYRQMQKGFAPKFRHQDPVATKEGIPVIKAGMGRKNALAYDEQALRQHLEKELKLTPKAPPAREGFITANQLYHTLRDHRYNVTMRDIYKIFNTLSDEFNEHNRKSDRSLRDGIVLTTHCGVPVSVARTTRGNQMVAAIKVNAEAGEKDILSFAVERLALQQQNRLLPEPPKGFVLLDDVYGAIEAKFGLSARETFEVIGLELEDRYDRIQDKKEEPQRHQRPMRTSEVLRGVPLHVIRARKGANENGLYVLQADIKHALQAIGLSIDSNLAPVPNGYKPYADIVARLEDTELAQTGLVNTMLQLLEAEYDKSQKELAPSKRHRAVFKTNDGVHVIRAMTKDGPRICFNEKDILEKAPAILGVSSVSQGEEIQESHGKPDYLAALLEIAKQVPDIMIEDERDKKGFGKIVIRNLSSTEMSPKAVLRVNPKSRASDNTTAEKVLRQVLEEASKRHGKDY